MAPLEIAVPWRSSKSASPLQCALVKNVSLSPVECALRKSLDLISPEINTYGKCGGTAPSLPSAIFVCQSVFIRVHLWLHSFALACLSASYHCQGIATGGRMFMQGGKQFGLRWCLTYCGCRAWKA